MTSLHLSTTQMPINVERPCKSGIIHTIYTVMKVNVVQPHTTICMNVTDAGKCKKPDSIIHP